MENRDANPEEMPRQKMAGLASFQSAGRSQGSGSCHSSPLSGKPQQSSKKHPNLWELCCEIHAGRYSE